VRSKDNKAGDGSNWCWLKRSLAGVLLATPASSDAHAAAEQTNQDIR